MKTRSRSFYLALVIFSLVGQIAWVVENMYLNVFIYNMFSASPDDISLMVLASAVSAALTTIVMGALSDKLGKRKAFMVGGYILWGISIMGFSLLRMDVLEPLTGSVASAMSLGITMTIIFDCLMTFFGSTANDACFNAWLTDSTDSRNRGRAEGINSMMPLVAILVVFGGFMAFDLTRASSWTSIYLIIGVAVILIGILGIFIVREPDISPAEDRYIETLIHGFRPSVIRRDPRFFTALASAAVFGIAIQTFMPYLIIYYTAGLGMDNYVLIMAPAIILASFATLFWGRMYDRRGFRGSVLLPMGALACGFVVLFFTRTEAPVFIGSLLMMCGYLCGSAIYGALLRDTTPSGEAGRFQGPRIVFQVLIPGVIGPRIGAFVLRNAETVVGTDGTETFIPNEQIFLAALVVILISIALLPLVFKVVKPPHADLSTQYTEGVADARSCHPRPQLMRDSYMLLDGQWDFAFSRSAATDTYDLTVTVPYPPESALSGIGRTHRPGTYLHYRRSFVLPDSFRMERTLLHFGAVDQICTVYVNGSEAGRHEGGYIPFTLDITELLREGENILSVAVLDDLDMTYPYGKQCRRPHGMWYTPFSGIWQSVWLENVPRDYIERIELTPTLDSVSIRTYGASGTKTLRIGDETYTFDGDTYTLSISDPVLWTPDEPHLYYFTLECGDDTVRSYFALRTVTVEQRDGRPITCLNGKPIFFHGLLDQGYFPDGISTPPSPECYISDIMAAKALGFNTLRKHIKIEPAAFYYECDRLGMIVWQDMVNNSPYRFLRDTALPTLGKQSLDDRRFKVTERARRVFLDHMRSTVTHLYNHPSVCLWTIFNEGWGQFDSDSALSELRSLDPTRLIDPTSGWFAGHNSDFRSLHVYFRRFTMPTDTDTRPVLLTEFGGYGLPVPGHMWQEQGTMGYRNFGDSGSLTSAIRDLYEQQIIPACSEGLCAAIYTQLTDVEGEINGLYTYDRAVCKVDAEIMQQISSKLLY